MNISRREAIAGLAGAAALGGARSVARAQDEQSPAHAPVAAVMRRRIPKTGSLNGGEVLPGFVLPLATLFASGTRRSGPRRKS